MKGKKKRKKRIVQPPVKVINASAQDIGDFPSPFDKKGWRVVSRTGGMPPLSRTLPPLSIKDILEGVGFILLMMFCLGSPPLLLLALWWWAAH
jgi:hypothetical protein